MTRAVFIDKDGTLIPDLPYNVDPERITLAPEVAKALRRLKDNDYLLILVSNQSGVAHGYFPMSALEAVREKIQFELRKQEVQFDDMYFCPHHPDGKVERYSIPCECRKPNPGMIHEAARVHEIDLKHSWMIGDILNDVEAGNRAGCKTILIDNGNETEWLESEIRRPTLVADSLPEAIRAILKIQEHEQ